MRLGQHFAAPFEAPSSASLYREQTPSAETERGNKAIQPPVQG